MTDATMTPYICNRRCACTRCRMQGMTVPALLVALGVMLLLENLHVTRGNSWIAMLLIVFGAVRLLQHSASTEGHRQPVIATVPPVPPPVATQPSVNYEEVNRG